MALPALRYLDISPMDHEGDQVFCFHDPEGYVEHEVVLSPMAFFIAAQLDGIRDIEAVQGAFKEYSEGIEVPADRVLEVVNFLDDQGFLQSDKFRELRAEIDTGFRRATVRPAHLAGKSYPEDPAALRAYIDGFFNRESGPGELPKLVSNGKRCLPGLIVPHIDFDRGGHAYAHGFLRLAQRGKPRTVIVFGVAHASPGVPFILTRKGFDTPLGTVACDSDIVDRLAEACDYDPFEYEMVHRTEHSIEFQAVMLAYLYGCDVRIVPILCGSFMGGDGGGNTLGSESVEQFLAVCRSVIAESDGEITVLAGADLAHVGRRFGDDFEIDDRIVAEVTERDREDLAHAVAADADSWYNSVMRDENARRVCGLNCIYSAIRTVSGISTGGELIHYDYAPDPSGGIVSFANVVFD
jgi:hypothetical protein